LQLVRRGVKTFIHLSNNFSLLEVLHTSQLVYPFIYKTATFLLPRRIVFGVNTIERIGEEMKTLTSKKIIIVTGPVVSKTGVVEKVMASLEKAGLEASVFDKVGPEPRIEMAEEAVEVARSGGFDGVIGVGGGSVMDIAKVASISLTNPGAVKNYLGLNQVAKKGVPLICAPTTAGTGSEVTRFSLLVVGNVKRSINSPNIVPDIALVDPMLTVSSPTNVTAGSGLDALSHAIESMMSTEITPLADALALEAVNFISRYLRVAYHHGGNIEARTYLSLAATMAGLAFNQGLLVLGHSVAMTFGPLYNVPHGTSCGMSLPYIMEYYLTVAADKLTLIARAMGENVGDLTPREAALKAIHAVRRLVEDVEIPLSLKEIGVPKEQLPTFAEACVRDWPRPNSPRKLTKESVLKVFERLWSGEGPE